MATSIGCTHMILLLQLIFTTRSYNQLSLSLLFVLAPAWFPIATSATFSHFIRFKSQYQIKEAYLYRVTLSLWGI